MMSDFSQQKTNSYCSKTENDKTNTSFLLEESFTQWRSSEHMKSSVDNPAQKTSLKLRENFAESSKTNKLKQFLKKSSETSSGLDNYSFNNLFEIFRSKSENKKK